MNIHDTCIKILLFGMLTFVLLGCQTEEELDPSGIETGYMVPQGDHDYDSVIVDYFDRFGSNLLYEFTDKDAYWTPQGWDNGSEGYYDSGGALGFLVTPAESDYIMKQLNLLEATWFQFYSNEFMQKFLPFKILLCSEVDVMDFDYSSWPYQVKGFPVGGYFHYDQISVSYASETIDAMTKSDSLTYGITLHRLLMTSMLSRGVAEPTAEFASSVDYSKVSSLYTNSEIWAAGSFQPYYYASAEYDWKYYLLMMVSYSEEYLTRDPGATSEYDWTETAWEGIFYPSKDVNGLLKARYDMVRNYYINNYGTDLQEIGNAMMQE